MIEVLKQALEALKEYVNVVVSVNDPNDWRTVADGGKPAREAITSLRQAIEQAEKQKPMAPRCMGTNCRMPDAENHSPECIWETAKSQGWSDAPEAIEARQAIAETEKQEPVAWMWDVYNGAGYTSRGIGFQQTNIPFAKHTPLYTHPQPTEERNFCPRCGKRTNDIHTCTPPKGEA
jgi:hypothetical protein